MRLIDADALDAIGYKGTDGRPDTFDAGVIWALEKMDSMPTIDAVPVVRCRECRYSRNPNRAFRDEAVACEGVLVCFVGFDHVHPTSDDGMIFVVEEEYCSQGQRREDGDA